MKLAIAALAMCLTVSGAALAAPQAQESELDSIQNVKLEKQPPLPALAARNDVDTKDAMSLATARAGNRIVAVGDRGIVLLSDDDGRSFRQAKKVPIDAALTDVHFPTDREGWAVGQWGTIVHTADAGETWETQRVDSTLDIPLFSVYFRNEREGWAVGLWSLLLETRNGGVTWEQRKVEKPRDGPKVDINFMKIFADPRGYLYIDGEQGYVLRSDDSGASWKYLKTGYNGTFWTGVATSEEVVVAGLRGSIYVSRDEGKTWKPASSGFKSSITDVLAEGSKIYAVGLDGVVLSSVDGGAVFDGMQRSDRASITAAVLRKDGSLLLFSKHGVLRDATSEGQGKVAKSGK